MKIIKQYKYQIGNKLYDSPYWLISECCGANIDEEKPFKYESIDNTSYPPRAIPNLLYISEGVCSKCNKKSEFYDKHYKDKY